jgi:spore germination protein YaaH
MADVLDPPADAELDEEAPAPPPRTALVSLVIALVGVLAIVAVGTMWPRSEWVRSGPPIAVSAWAPYWQTDEALASFAANADMFRDLSVVAWSARSAGEVTRYEGLDDDEIAAFRTIADQHDVEVYAMVFDDTPAGTMASILADPATRRLHAETLAAKVDAEGWDGVDVDYENFAFADDRSSWAGTRPNWIAFLTELRDALDEHDADLVVSVPPVYDGGQTDASGYWVYDYAAMADVVDRIRVMAYDYSFRGGDPGPVAPTGWVAEVVDAVGDLVPPEMVDLGVPVYGYDWVVSTQGTCPADQQPENRSVSTANAERLVAEQAVTPVRDPATDELAFDYVTTLSGTDAAGVATSCTVNRTVRYLDAVAIHDRAWLAHRGDLHGVVLWALGNDDPLTWDGLRAARLGDETWPTEPSAGTTTVTP